MIAVAAALAMLLLWWILAPDVLHREGGAILLVAGAVVGVPHGSSDFIEAHRLLRPTLGALWLPMFVAAYMACVLTVMAGWHGAPLATLIVFLVLSGLHFGTGDADDRGHWSAVVRLAKATTPLVPIFLIHPADVAPYLAELGKLPTPNVIDALSELHGLIWPWAVCIGLAATRAAFRLIKDGDTMALVDAAELVMVALAAVLLPALVAFAFFFCCVHAVQHLGRLTTSIHPLHPFQAWRLAGLVLIPSAAVCSIALLVWWSALGGALTTHDVACQALRLIAALTVPHMILDVLSSRQARESPDGSRNITAYVEKSIVLDH